jgi:hypothetical protein
VLLITWLQRSPASQRRAAPVGSEGGALKVHFTPPPLARISESGPCQLQHVTLNALVLGHRVRAGASERLRRAAPEEGCGTSQRAAEQFERATVAVA